MIAMILFKVLGGMCELLLHKRYLPALVIQTLVVLAVGVPSAI